MVVLMEVIPISRRGHLRDPVGAVLYSASEMASYIVGSILRVSSGGT